MESPRTKNPQFLTMDLRMLRSSNNSMSVPLVFPPAFQVFPSPRMVREFLYPVSKVDYSYFSNKFE